MPTISSARLAADECWWAAPKGGWIDGVGYFGALRSSSAVSVTRYRMLGVSLALEALARNPNLLILSSPRRQQDRWPLDVGQL